MTRGSRNQAAVCIALFSAVVLCAPAKAQVLDIQPDGSVVTYTGPARYSDTGAQPLVQTPSRPSDAPVREPPPEVAQAILLSSQRHGVSPVLLQAVAWQESRFRQTAISPKGARGVMQLMPDTAKRLGADARDLAANIDGGAAYLKQMMTQFGGDLPLVLAAYNAGPGAVARFGGVPPYAETKAYVNAILSNLARPGGALQ